MEAINLVTTVILPDLHIPEPVELQEIKETDKNKVKKSSYSPEKAAERREQEERRKAKLHQAFLEAPERERLTMEIIHHKRRLNFKVYSGFERQKDQLLSTKINVFTSPLVELQSFCQELIKFGA